MWAARSGPPGNAIPNHPEAEQCLKHKENAEGESVSKPPLPAAGGAILRKEPRALVQPSLVFDERRNREFEQFSTPSVNHREDARQDGNLAQKRPLLRTGANQALAQ
jgi:hypothetical protein